MRFDSLNHPNLLNYISGSWNSLQSPLTSGSHYSSYHECITTSTKSSNYVRKTLKKKIINPQFGNTLQSTEHLYLSCMLTFDTLSLGYQQFQFLTYTLGASQDLLTILKLPMTVLTWFTSIPNSHLSHHCMIYSRGIRQFHNVAYSLFHCCTPWNCHTAVISKMIGSIPRTSDCFTDCIILLTSPPWFTHLEHSYVL